MTRFDKAVPIIFSILSTIATLLLLYITYSAAKFDFIALRYELAKLNFAIEILEKE